MTQHHLLLVAAALWQLQRLLLQLLHLYLPAAAMQLLLDAAQTALAAAAAVAWMETLA
jgi:hypothetical protein